MAVINTESITGGIKNAVGGAFGMLTGQASPAWSRKFIFMIGCFLVAWKIPTFVMPQWLLYISLAWISGQSLVDAAKSFGEGKPKPPIA